MSLGARPDRWPVLRGARADHPRLLSLKFDAGAFVWKIGAWIREGRIRYGEDIRDRRENAPAASTRLLEGENFRKPLVRVAPDPTR